MAEDRPKADPDPWKQAQEGPFTVSAARPTPQQISGTAAGSTAQAPARQPVSPLPPGAHAPGTLPSGRGGAVRTVGVIVAIGLLVVVVGAIVAAVYLYMKSASRAVSTGVSVAERTRAEVTLVDAMRTEMIVYAETNGFTDDQAMLKSRLPNLAWERGSDPERVGAVYVEVCDSAATSVLLQTRTDRGNVFAIWIDGPRSTTYYALGPVSCPLPGDDGSLGAPWSGSKDEAWGGTVPGGEGAGPIELPPPAGGPRAPTVPSPYGGSSPTPYGGSPPSGYGDSGSGRYEPYP